MQIKPKKSLGQNFLIDKNIIKKIVEVEHINSDDFILEVGPGTGNLTEFILKKNPKKLFVIEKDKNLIEVLKKKFGDQINIIENDILRISENEISDSQLIVFGNLPYNISAKLLINLVRLNNLKTLFSKFVLMFQKEVADRIVASVNSSKYGRLAILTNWKMAAKKITDIDSERPKKGLNEEIIRFISQKKKEPEWMLSWRLSCYKKWLKMPQPNW